jgi:hypothetical protein
LAIGALIVPRRAFASAADAERFRDLAERLTAQSNAASGR